jgi:hypothetical protein
MESELTSFTGDKAMATKTKRGPNKTSFVRDFLQKNPTATRKAVEEAWREAGHEGPISSALVSNLRSKLGLTGSRRSGSKAAEGKGAPESIKATAGRPKRRKRRRSARVKKNGSVAESAEGRKTRSGGLDGALAEIEGDIDRLIFKTMALGGMEEIEEGLRKVRRLLYRSYRM